MPRRFHTISSLPRTPTGKLVKRKLDPSLARS
jgi:fatty-acyl-CoA synthase